MSARIRLAAVAVLASIGAGAAVTVAWAAPAPGQVGNAVPLAVAAGAPAHAAGLFKSGDGADRGQAVLTEAPGGVLITLKLTGLPPGWHAIHLHAKGDCSDAAFTAAGGHINHATPKPHGLLNPQGPDFGDLTNIFVAADGTSEAELYTTLVSLRGAGGRDALLDADGSSIVIHANRDDYTSQPIGGAGARIACAVLAGA